MTVSLDQNPIRSPHEAERDNPRIRSTTLRHKIAIIAFASMIFAWLFDFRSEGAGEGLVFQAVFMTLYIASFLVFAFSAQYTNLSAIIIFLLLSLNFLITGIFSGLFLKQDTFGLLRNAFNVIIYVTSAFSAFIFVRMVRENLILVRKILSVLSIAYMFWGVFVVSYFQGGWDISTVRYEIIGTSVVVSLAYASLFLRFKLMPYEIISAILAVLVVVISATRTWALVFLLQAALIVTFGGFFKKGVVSRVALLGVISSVAIGTLQISGSSTIERWTERLFVSNRVGIDPTALTRERQVDSMLDSILKRPLFGNGFYGQSSYWLEKNLGGGDGYSSGNGFGHNQDVSIVFVAGVIGGLPILLLQYWIGVRSICLVRRNRAAGYEDDFAVLCALSCLCILGTQAYGQFGGTFGSRGLTLWYGVATGMLLGLQSLQKTIRRTQFPK